MNVMKCVFGSHLYGLNTASSDTDYKGIFIPSKEQIILQRAPNTISHSTSSQHQRNTAADVDTEMFALHYFMHLLSKGETVAIDMLHVPDDSPHLLETSEAWVWLRENRSQFYTTKMHAYLGYVRRQASKYGIKGSRMAELGDVIAELKVLDPNKKLFEVIDYIRESPLVKKKEEANGLFLVVLDKMFQTTNSVEYVLKQLEQIYTKFGERTRLAAENQGIDWKALSHAIRAGYQLKEIYTTGDLVYPLVERDLIMKVKTGCLDFKTEVEPILIDLIEEVDALAITAAANGMRSSVDQKLVDTFVFCHYHRSLQPNFWS